MQSGLEVQKVAPDAYRAMLGFQSYVNNSGLEPAPMELVRIRASQLNGCAYCTPRMRAPLGSPSSESTRFRLGARRRSSPTGNARRSPGQRRSH